MASSNKTVLLAIAWIASRLSNHQLFNFFLPKISHHFFLDYEVKCYNAIRFAARWLPTKFMLCDSTIKTAFYPWDTLSAWCSKYAPTCSIPISLVRLRSHHLISCLKWPRAKRNTISVREGGQTILNYGHRGEDGGPLMKKYLGNLQTRMLWLTLIFCCQE